MHFFSIISAVYFFFNSRCSFSFFLFFCHIFFQNRILELIGTPEYSTIAPNRNRDQNVIHNYGFATLCNTPLILVEHGWPWVVQSTLNLHDTCRGGDYVSTNSSQRFPLISASLQFPIILEYLDWPFEFFPCRFLLSNMIRSNNSNQFFLGIKT